MKKIPAKIFLGRARIILAAFVVLLFSYSMEGDLSAMPPVKRVVLPNQLTLLTSEDHSLPIVIVQLLIDTGSRRDPQGQEGLAALTARGLLLGTERQSVTQINEELDFMGAHLGSSAGKDYTVISLTVLKKDLDRGMDLLMDSLTTPAFPEEELKKDIEKTLGAVRAAEDNPGDVAEKAFDKTLFMDPYSHPVEGTKESLPRLKREEVVAFHDAYYHPNNAILTVVGDITPEEVKAKLFPRLEKWSSRPVPGEDFRAAFEGKKKEVKIGRDITQANIILGHEGVSRENPDYYALSVMNYILGGGGFASRMFNEIRTKRGLAYSVRSFFDPGKYPGSFRVSLETKNASAREAISLAMEQMELIRKEPVSDRELEGAKRYLTGSFPMRFDTLGKLAGFIMQVEYFHLGLDYADRYPSIIGAITAADILRVAKSYLHPEDSILVIVANLKEAGME